MIEASAPGKLYIAGEYAVLEPGQPAILVALNQYITVKLTKTDTQGSIRSSLTNHFPIPWTRRNGKVFIDERENPFAYVVQAMMITEKYAVALGKKVSFFDIEIQSDLDNKDGRKYGLGSSGAVTVATIKALLKFYQVPYDNELIYKLAALAHLAINSNGSFGDLAASTYGGWIAYSCFDRDWVREKLVTVPILTLLEATWPKLAIEALTPPENLSLLIGWTGSPASTTHLVDRLNEEKDEISIYYRHFLADSRQVVQSMIDAFKMQDLTGIQQGIRANRRLLQDLGKSSGVHIETLSLYNLCESAEDMGGAAKSSGAGGGDCGIVIIDEKIDTHELFASWKDNHIVPLPLAVHEEREYTPL